MTHRRFAILKLATLGLSLSFAGLALAQEKFPSRPVTIVVPQAAGGANDAIARVVAQKLSEQWGQTVKTGPVQVAMWEQPLLPKPKMTVTPFWSTQTVRR